MDRERLYGKTLLWELLYGYTGKTIIYVVRLSKTQVYRFPVPDTDTSCVGLLCPAVLPLNPENDA
jgi:hypothetical protein